MCQAMSSSALTIDSARVLLQSVKSEHAKYFMESARAAVGSAPATSAPLREYFEEVCACPRDWMMSFPSTWKSAASYRKVHQAMRALLELGVVGDVVPAEFEKSVLKAHFTSANIHEVLALRRGGVPEAISTAETVDFSGHSDCASEYPASEPIRSVRDSKESRYVHTMRRVCESLAAALKDEVTVAVLTALWHDGDGWSDHELESVEVMRDVLKLISSRAPVVLLLQALRLTVA